ncbi:competence/damage-inducible protein A [Sphingobacterium sp. SGR-19]|uniref:competence/damage-inducible protein A n=1 Tax=Sphingobacterium sp. SGR-19 TaxID=2710886 RepID=UPI0013ED0B84|nr:competence/damage-inducible protein A [Sphingobacterium sp. SGR-19]NGM67165.1 competence/damage-inducible protein A [Sphingobacterium sp. SGR-19]
MKAEIITIGDELLNGQVVDTNSAWIAQRMGELHIPVVHITSISDKAYAIKKALQQAEERADVIIMTGGLGPTRDDITKAAVADYFGTTLVRNEAVLAHVQEIFHRSGRKHMPAMNIGQADVLANATVLFNDFGTAPGMAVGHNGKYFAFLPGVPFEMKFLMDNRVLPMLRDTYKSDVFIYNTYLMTVGIGESHLAEQLADIEDTLPSFISLAYLPRIGMVRLRFTGEGTDMEALTSLTNSVKEQVVERVKDHVVSVDNRSFEEVLVQTFTDTGVTLSTAESCTGGSISARITAVPGASQMFQGAAVVYSNRAKIDVLGVLPDTLTQYGAVSEPTVKEMAEGARRVFGTDYAIATSGIAGPGGGTETKPVGTVCIAVAGKSETRTQTFHFKNDRAINIERTVVAGLTMLWDILK